MSTELFKSQDALASYLEQAKQLENCLEQIRSLILSQEKDQEKVIGVIKELPFDEDLLNNLIKLVEWIVHKLPEENSSSDIADDVDYIIYTIISLITLGDARKYIRRIKDYVWDLPPSCKNNLAAVSQWFFSSLESTSLKGNGFYILGEH